ncbi:MAG: signal peptidase I [Armatimonadetes bacterium]|nr:signal peptidase I [Armatimonadota bacterium]
MNQKSEGAGDAPSVVLESESASGVAPDAFSVSAGTAASAAPKRTTFRIAREWFETLFLTLILFLFAETFLLQGFKVYGHCMEPNLYSGERLLGNKLVYRFGSPGRGDVVVFRYPEDPSKVFIKRVIGLPGDRVALRSGKLYVHGKALAEPYVVYPFHGDFESETVPPGHLFVLGDNRDYSNDSRFWGMLPIRNVEARAWFRYWPLNRIATLHRE